MDTIIKKNQVKLLEDKKLYGRLDEYIQAALSPKALNLCGVVIKGHTGTGKTFLVENYLQHFVAVYPVLMARHNSQQEAIPYAGFRHGIADFLNNAYHSLGEEKYKNFSSALKAQLGDNFHLLCDYIPELTILLDKHTDFGARSNLKIENQLYPSFKILFSTLSELYGKPILFFTDDLQFMDGPGMNLLKYLLVQLAPKQLVWIGAYREPQGNLFPISQLGESLNLDKKYIENISLKEFSLAQGHFFMERWLDGPCSPELSEICHGLSEANLSQLQVLLESLKKDRLIYLKEGIWEGNYPRIQKQYQGQNARRIVRERMDQLPNEAQEMLGLIACMGGFNRRLLLGYFGENEELLAACLDKSHRLGLLVPEEKGFRFSESHIGEMIYDWMTAEEKSAYHYRIAKLIHQRQGGRLAFSKQIMMTGHFNQALDQVRKNGELEFCAALNFRAGSLYRQDQVFDQAKMYFKISADLYKECPWEKVRDQVWEVNLERAKVEYALGEYDLAEIHLDYLLDRFMDPVARTEAFEWKIIINSHLGRYRKVVSILKESLSELGLELPLEETRLLQEISKLKLLYPLGENDIISKNSPADRQQAILKLLSAGGMGLHHTSDILMTWAALQIITRSEKVQSAVRAIGYVSYGRMNIISGEIEKGVELGRTGLEYTLAQQDWQYRCRVFGVFAFYIQPWQSAFMDSKGLLEEGMDAGRQTGDLIGLYILKTHQFNLHFISGAPIEDLLHYDFEEFYPGRELTYYITHYQKSLIRFLTGETAAFSIPRPQPSTLAAHLTIQEEKFYRNHVWARYYFLFGYYELAMQYGKEAHQNRKLQEGSPLVPANLLIIFLSITQNWHHWSQPQRVPLGRELQEILEQMELWSRHAAVNYLGVLYLFYAEWYRIQGEADEKVVAYYLDSLAHAGANIYLRALTHETLARYYLATRHQPEKIQVHLGKAIHHYRLWGGLAKARQLFQQYYFLLKDESSAKPELDIEMVLRELSGDLDFSSLLQKLMTLLLRVSGSTRVVIEWMENHGEAKGTEVMDLLGFQEDKNIPVGLIRMAQRTQELMVANDLRQKNLLSEVGLLEEQGVKSFVILPITLSGSYSMTIYLENSFGANGYQKEQMKWIRITANQGAVVIENARTHEKTVKLNEKIQKEMTEKQLLASQIEAQKDAHLRQLIDMQESERKRIAGDLHDSLGSLLSGIKLRFHSLKDLTPLGQPEQAPLYREMLSQLDEAVEEVRRIAHNMSPVSLRRFGLQKALQTLIEQINASARMEADLQLLGLEQRLPEQLELTVYRICQELVQNVLRHAGGSQLRVQIIQHPDILNVMVEDNGLGMNIDNVKPGFGFVAIQSKVKLLQGDFTIESQPGKGFTAIVDIPYRP